MVSKNFISVHGLEPLLLEFKSGRVPDHGGGLFPKFFEVIPPGQCLSYEMPARPGRSRMLSLPDRSPSAHFGQQAHGRRCAVGLAARRSLACSHSSWKTQCLWTPQSSGSLQRASPGRPSNSQEITQCPCLPPVRAGVARAKGGQSHLPMVGVRGTVQDSVVYPWGRSLSPSP